MISTRGDDAADQALQDAFQTPGEFAGADFAALVAQTRQVIDGTFWASHRERGRDWLRLEAIDSSFWEVGASSPEYLEPFRARFRDVRS